ncbi:hypothetical protein [Mycobacterium sp.]|nr:hypothetical protein [Mycobacterium sp.]HTQ22733.1 hypothetical protein [Mycobacterium sp.]
MDNRALPLDVNSARKHARPGSGSMPAAAAATAKCLPGKLHALAEV